MLTSTTLSTLIIAMSKRHALPIVTISIITMMQMIIVVILITTMS